MKINFTNDIGYRLSAELDVPEGLAPFPVVIFSHGFDSSKESPRTVPITKDLQKRKIASFRFDYTGHGDSEGSKEESTFSRQLNDLDSAIKKVESLPLTNKNFIALHGSSSGCLTCLTEIEETNFKAAVLRAPRVNGYYPTIEEKAYKIETPILAIQGEQDPMLEETQMFFGKIRSFKKMAIVKDADHLFSEPSQFEKVRNIAVTWLEKMLT